jgi:hypothetical protein
MCGRVTLTGVFRDIGSLSLTHTHNPAREGPSLRSEEPVTPPRCAAFCILLVGSLALYRPSPSLTPSLSLTFCLHSGPEEAC